MKRISSRAREVAQMIAEREPFNTHGALRADKAEHLSYGDSGKLEGADLDQFRQDWPEIDYVVWSYWTPIAWHTPSGWHRVAQRFSMTTSHHQGKLYLIGE